MSRSGSKTKLKGKAASRKDSAAAEPEEPEEEVVPQLAWRIINEETTKELRKMLSVEDVAQKLADVLSLKHREVCLMEAAQLDCFVAAYWYAAREKIYTNEQTSAFVTLLHILIDNVKSRQLSLAENFKELEKYVEGVSNPNSKTCTLKCFTNDVAIDAIRYLSHSLFQHYRLYQYLFTEQQQEDTITLRLPVETLPDPSYLDPPPLEEAMPLELYERCLAPKPSPLKDQETEEHLEETDAVENVQERVLEEQKSDVETELWMKISAEEMKSVLESLVENRLSAIQMDLLAKLKKKEENVTSRLSKLEKSRND